MMIANQAIPRRLHRHRVENRAAADGQGRARIPQGKQTRVLRHSVLPLQLQTCLLDD